MKILQKGETGYGVLIENDGYIIKDNNEEFLNEMYKLELGGEKINDPLYVYAVLQKYDTENKNGRWYPKELLYRENERYQSLIKTRSSLGEANHPNSSEISLKGNDTSHVIVETFWKGKTLIGKLEILTSPGFIKSGIISCAGDHIANLLRKNILIGVSSRGVGSLKKEGQKNVVQSDFELVCWDIVAQPSTPGSYMFTDMDIANKLWIEQEDKEQKIMDKRMESMKRFLGF
jgi:hypothetical protein